MALMDAGVPIKAPVAGIAMGLIKEGDRVAVLTDILGVEDHLGDMDFKVTGTREGITAFQMDTKIGGITFEIMDRRARARARRPPAHPRARWSSACRRRAPRCRRTRRASRSCRSTPTRSARSSGRAARSSRSITEETGAQIDIEDTGEVRIAAYQLEGGKRAEEIIRNIAEDPEVGRVYQGKVRSIVNFGAFVEIVPGRDGLLHISEIDHKRIARVEDVLNVGDMVDGQGHRRRPRRQDQALAQGAAAGARGTPAAASAAGTEAARRRPGRADRRLAWSRPFREREPMADACAPYCAP